MIYEEFSPEVKKYLIRKTPKSKDIFELIKRYKGLEEGDIKENLREDILMINSKLVAKLASKYASAYRSSRDDFFQSGMIGLMRALDLFDCERKCAFSTYATPWIKQTMGEERLQETPVMVTRGMRESVRKHMKKNHGEMDFSMKSESGRNAKSACLAMSSETYLFLDGYVKSKKHDSDTFFDISDNVDYEQKIFSLLIKEDVHREMLKILKPQEITVVKELHFKEVPSTLEYISKILGKGENTVRKLEKRSLRKLKNHFLRFDLGDMVKWQTRQP